MGNLEMLCSGSPGLYLPEGHFRIPSTLPHRALSNPGGALEEGSLVPLHSGKAGCDRSSAPPHCPNQDRPFLGRPQI